MNTLAFLVIILEFIANTQYLVCSGTKHTNFGMFYIGIFYVQTDCNRKPSSVSVDPSGTAQENNCVQGEGGQSVLLCQQQCNSWHYDISLKANKLLKFVLSWIPSTELIDGTVYLSLRPSLHRDIENVKANQLKA